MSRTPSVPDLPPPPPPWHVKVHPEFDRRLAALAVRRIEEVAWFIHQIWLVGGGVELGQAERQSLGETLEVEEVQIAGAAFYQATIAERAGSKSKESRVIFWVDQARLTIWLVDSAPSKAGFRAVLGSVHRRAARRVWDIKGGIQDGNG